MDVFKMYDIPNSPKKKQQQQGLQVQLELQTE
jgi:hypothetical protein